MGSEDEEKKKQQSAMNAAPGTIVQGAGGTSFSTGQGIGGTKSSTSGRATNLQSYLQANQGAKIGEEVGQKLQSTASQIGQNVSKAREDLRQQAYGAGGTPGNATGGEFGRLGQYQQYAQQIQQDPTKLSEQQIADFQKIRTGQYQTPEVQNLPQLQAQSQQAQQMTQLAGTEPGRFELLRQTFGRPTYSTGQQRLDQLLLQTNRGQAQALQSKANDARMQALQNIQGLESERGDIQKNLAALAGKTAGEATGLVSGESAKMEAAANEAIKQAQTKQSQQEALYNQYIDLFRKGGPGGIVSTQMPGAPQDTAQYAGRDPSKGVAPADLQAAYKTLDKMKSEGVINDEQYATLNKQAEAMVGYGATNPWEAFQQGLYYRPAEGLTRSGVLSPEQEARIQTLQKLSGQTPEQFGTEQFKQSAFTLDPSKLVDASQRGREDTTRIAKEAEFAQKLNNWVTSNHASRGTQDYWNYRQQLANEMNQKYGPGAFSTEYEGNVFGTVYDPSIEQRISLLKQVGLMPK